MLKLLSFILLFLGTTLFASSSILIQETFDNENSTEFINIFANEIIKSIFHRTFQQWFFTFLFCDITNFESVILKSVQDITLPVMLISSCPVNNCSIVKPKIDQNGVSTYLYSSSELSSEINENVIDAIKRTGVFNPRAPLVMLINVPVEMDVYWKYSMKAHFQDLWTRGMSNTVLIFWSGEFKLFTYNPFKKIVIEIKKSQDVSRIIKRFYHNLHGHPIRLSAYRTVFLTDKNGPVKCEGVIAKTIMNILNATCDPVSPRDNNLVGDIHKNGTATGATADLAQRYTDLELNSRILKISFNGYIDTTYPLAQDSLCFLVKKSQKHSTYTTISKLVSGDFVYAVTFSVISLILTSLVIESCEIKLIVDIEKKRGISTVMNLIKCFLRQTVDISFIGPVFRSMILLTMIYSLVINSVIDGILTSAITYPRYKPDINTLSELHQSSLTLAIHPFFWNEYMNDCDRDSYPYPVEFINEYKIKEIIQNRQFQYAVLLRKTFLLHLVSSPKNIQDGRPLFHIVDDCPFKCFIVYGLTYGSPYTTRVNEILDYLNEAGIIRHLSQSDEESPYLASHKTNVAEDSNGTRNLTMNNLLETFYLLIIGMIISLCVFVGEVFVFINNKITLP